MTAAAGHRRPWLVLAALAIAAGALWWSHLRLWYPHDEGLLAQSAIRVLHGQVPHRDFPHPYTGLDAVLHAGWVALFGASLAAIRHGFAIVVIGWLVALASVLRRAGSDQAVALAILLIGALGPAVYPAAMASWYVTMCVTLALALVLRPGMPTPATLVGAGVLLALGLGFKITAAYGIVGIGAWLIATRDDDAPAALLLIAILVVAALGLARLLLPATARTMVHLVLAPAAVLAWGIAREIRRWHHNGVAVGWGATRPLAWLGGGVALGALPTFAWLAWSGALPAFLHSTALAATLRAGRASSPVPSVAALLYGVPLVALGAALLARRPPAARYVVLLCAALFALAWFAFPWHRGVWLALRGGAVLAVLVACIGASRGRGPAPATMAVVAVFAWMLLGQYPFGAPIYFVYALPLAMLLPVGLGAGAERAGFRVLAATLAAFGYLQVIPGTLAALGASRHRPERLAVLPGVHGGLLVAPEDSATFGRLITVLHDSVPPGPIWAGPDAPEVAFLAGRDDLQRGPFAFLSARAAGQGDPADSAVAIVVQEEPPFSPAIDPAQRSAWSLRFDRSERIGSFTVLWKGDRCDSC